MLRANPSELRPVAAFESIRALSPSADDHALLFPKSFRATLVQITKWAADANDLPSAVVNTHSLRVGGATALFSAGVDWITIQRWGRWKSFAFHDYIWHDYSGFMDLGSKIASTRGLNKFLVDVAPNRKRVRFGDTPIHTTGASAFPMSVLTSLGPPNIASTAFRDRRLYRRGQWPPPPCLLSRGSGYQCGLLSGLYVIPGFIWSEEAWVFYAGFSLNSLLFVSGDVVTVSPFFFPDLYIVLDISLIFLCSRTYRIIVSVTTNLRNYFLADRPGSSLSFFSLRFNFPRVVFDLNVLRIDCEMSDGIVIRIVFDLCVLRRRIRVAYWFFFKDFTPPFLAVGQAWGSLLSCTFLCRYTSNRHYRAPFTHDFLFFLPFCDGLPLRLLLSSFRIIPLWVGRESLTPRRSLSCVTSLCVGLFLFDQREWIILHICYTHIRFSVVTRWYWVAIPVSFAEALGFHASLFGNPSCAFG